MQHTNDCDGEIAKLQSLLAAPQKKYIKKLKKGQKTKEKRKKRRRIYSKSRMQTPKEMHQYHNLNFTSNIAIMAKELSFSLFLQLQFPQNNTHDQHNLP